MCSGRPVFGPALSAWSASLRLMDPIDRDAELREDLAALGPGALAELQRVLAGSSDYRNAVLVALVARPEHADLATLHRDGRHGRGGAAAAAPSDPQLDL
jgi:hypothetical protein